MVLAISFVLGVTMPMCYKDYPESLQTGTVQYCGSKSSCSSIILSGCVKYGMIHIGTHQFGKPNDNSLLKIIEVIDAYHYLKLFRKGNPISAAVFHSCHLSI